MELLIDTLSTLRRTHLVLFIASVAVLVAAFPGENYDASLAEMRDLREFMAFGVDDRVGDSTVVGLCRSVSRTGFDGVVMEALEAAVPGRTAPRNRRFVEFSGVGVVCPYPDDETTLEELMAFITDGVRVEVAVPEADALVEFLRRTVATRPHANDRLSFLLSGWPGLDQLGLRVLREWPRNARTDSVIVTIVYSAPERKDDTHSAEEVLPASGEIAFFRPSREFRARRVWTALLGPPDDRFNITALPTLRAAPIWEEVRTLSIPEAVRYVQSLARNEDGTMEVLGFRVSAQILGWAGPPLLVMLLVHLLLHARHLQRHGPKHPEVIEEFPWLPLFADRSAQVSAVLSLCVLPPAAAGLVAWRLLELSPVTAAWAGLMALLTVSLSVRVLKTLQGVRAGAS